MISAVTAKNDNVPRAACCWLLVRSRATCCAFLLLFFSAHFSARSGEDLTALRERIDLSLARGIEALWKLQDSDGGWHSRTYGHLKPGVATTALVLETLATIDPGHAAGDFERAEKFLVAWQGKDGGLGSGGDWLEYPTYSTALGILAFVKLKPNGWEKTIEPWVKYLTSAQHTERNGCAAGDAAYGGWGPEGAYVNGRGRGSNISATRFALDALTQANALDMLTRFKALTFVRSCQAGDGGFFFSPVTAELNKAGGAEGRFNAYGSATIDGVNALILCGISGTTPAISISGGATGEKAMQLFVQTPEALERAYAWLDGHMRIERCPGFNEKDTETWGKGMVLYYRQGLLTALLDRAASSPSKPAEIAAIEKIAVATLAFGRRDGIWQSLTVLMKEDDPLIGTPLALKTLWQCRAALAAPKP